MKMMKILFCLLLVPIALRAEQLKVVSHFETQNVRFRSMVGPISDNGFEKMALDYLESKETTLGLVLVYGSLNDRARAGPGSLDHCAYSLWRSKLEAMNVSAHCPHIMEAVKIGSSIIITKLDRDCKRTQKRVAGTSDPLDLQIGETKLRILNLGFSRASTSPADRRLWAGLALKTNGAVSVDLARSALIQIRELTGAEYLMVELRSDIWFKGSCGFPVFFPFEDRPKSPDVAEYAKTMYSTCMALGATDLRCSESKSSP